MRSRGNLVFALVLAAACDATVVAPTDPNAPTNITYQLEPSGDPSTPAAVLLTWTPPSNGRAGSYDVYGRSGHGDYLFRATTSSPSFHDVGAPQDQYYVIAVDAN